MTTQRNPENKQEHRPHDLVQIIAVQKRNPYPWVIVEQAGTDEESIRADFAVFAQASKACRHWYYGDEMESLNVKIMRRNDDGTLTTEF